MNQRLGTSLLASLKADMADHDKPSAVPLSAGEPAAGLRGVNKTRAIFNRQVEEQMRPAGAGRASVCCFRAVANGALRGAELPTRLKVLDWGVSRTAKGQVLLGAKAVEIEARQKAAGFERVAIDFEHNTVPSSPEFQRTTEPRPVAGYGTLRLVPGEGLYLESITWTPQGQAHARNFEDLSPALVLDAGGEVTFVHSVALTRAGAVEGLTFYSAG